MIEGTKYALSQQKIQYGNEKLKKRKNRHCSQQ
jgi:hypothetical protein